MIPATKIEDFPESNKKFMGPGDLEDSQCGALRAYMGEVEGGSCDGVPIIVTAWYPNIGDLHAMNSGKPIYLTIIGTGLPPHFLSTDFHSSTHPQ